jgi:hypothetical protein
MSSSLPMSASHPSSIQISWALARIVQCHTLAISRHTKSYRTTCVPLYRCYTAAIYHCDVQAMVRSPGHPYKAPHNVTVPTALPVYGPGTQFGRKYMAIQQYTVLGVSLSATLPRKLTAPPRRAKPSEAASTSALWSPGPRTGRRRGSR